MKPVCRHFGVCGGCSVQHMAPQSYRAWKRDSVVAAFRARGLDIEVAPLISPGGKRRRAVFTMERTESGIVVGFHEAASHAIVSIEECPVLEPKIVAALPALTDLLAPLLSKRGEARLTVLLTNSGLDVRLDGTARQLTSEVQQPSCFGSQCAGARAPCHRRRCRLSDAAAVFNVRHGRRDAAIGRLRSSRRRGRT